MEEKKIVDILLEENDDTKNEQDFKDLNYVEGLLMLQKMYEISTDEIVQTLNVTFLYISLIFLIFSSLFFL